MNIQQKIEILMRHYSQTEIADKLSRLSGKRVHLATVNAYATGRNKQIRIPEVAAAFDKLYEETKELEG